VSVSGAPTCKSSRSCPEDRTGHRIRHQVHGPLVGDESRRKQGVVAWGLPRPHTPRSPPLSSSPWRCRARAAPPRWSSGWRTGCSFSSARLATSTKPSRSASETIRARGSSSRCPASALTWVRSSWSSPAVIWPPSLPQDDWPPTPDWFLRQGIPAVSSETCADPNATTADYAGCCTWRHYPASGPTAPPGRVLHRKRGERLIHTRRS
jgi:hypothetical protein